MFASSFIPQNFYYIPLGLALELFGYFAYLIQDIVGYMQRQKNFSLHERIFIAGRFSWLFVFTSFLCPYFFRYGISYESFHIAGNFARFPVENSANVFRNFPFINKYAYLINNL